LLLSDVATVRFWPSLLIKLLSINGSNRCTADAELENPSGSIGSVAFSGDRLLSGLELH
jgi:hypothetical protein